MVIPKQHSRREQMRAARRRDTQRSALWLVAGGAALLLLVGLALLNQPATVSGRARAGAKMPEFTLTNLQGQAVHLSDYAGQVVLVNAWATWCPPCRAEMPALYAFYQAHQAEGFELLAVNAGEDQATVKSFIAQEGFTFPVLLDPGTGVLNGLGIDAFPTSVLIGRDGLVKNIHIGYYAPETVQADVAPLLK